MRIKYAFIGLNKNLINTFLIILQVSLMCCAIYFTLDSSQKIIEQSNYYGEIFSSSKVYNISFMDSPSNYLDLNNNNEANLIKLEKSFNNNKYQRIHINANPITIPIFDGYTDFYANNSIINIDGENAFQAKNITIDENYMNKFPFKLYSGDYFSKEDFLNETYSNEFAVILGYNYKNYFNIGDKFKIFIDNKFEDFTIIGFVDKDQFSIGNVTSMNNKYINLNNTVITSTNIYRTYEMYIFSELMPSSYFFFNNNMDLKEIEDTKNDISQIFRRYSNIEINWRDLNEHIESEVMYFNEQRNISLIASIVITIFVIVTLFITIIELLRKRRFEFAIHQLIGATKKNIFEIILIQILIIIVCGFFISIQIIRIFNDFKPLNFKLLIYMYVVEIIIMLIFSLIPLSKINKFNISQIIKGDD